MRRRWIALLTLFSSVPAMSACGGSAADTSADGSSRVLITSARTSARAADSILLKLLQKHGAHLARPRSTRLYLDFPREDDERAAAKDVPRGYSAEELGKIGSGDTYVLRLTTVMVVGLDSIGRREAALEAIARRHHGALDGWEAAPTP